MKLTRFCCRFFGILLIANAEIDQRIWPSAVKMILGAFLLALHEFEIVGRGEDAGIWPFRVPKWRSINGPHQKPGNVPAQKKIR